MSDDHGSIRWVTSTSAGMPVLRAAGMVMVVDLFMELPHAVPAARQHQLAEGVVHEYKEGRQVVVATLLEIPLLRLLRCVREKVVAPDHVTVVMLNRRGVPTYIRVDGTGELMDVCPEGFFEERAVELF